jgi:hypothetical protein
MNKEIIKKFFADKQNRLIILALLLLFFFAFALPQKNEVKVSDNGPMEADTIIPPDVTAIPIEIANHKSLVASVGAYAYVNVFSLQADGTAGKKVGHRLRLLRAPFDPNEFLVLVPESEEAAFMQHSGPFFVSVLSRENQGQSKVKLEIQKKQHISRIELLEE